MARAKKDTRTELQKAADRVAEMEVAVANTKQDLNVCEEEFKIAELAYAEAERNLRDTQDLLNARINKLQRERSTAMNHAGGIMATWNVTRSNIAEKDDSPY